MQSKESRLTRRAVLAGSGALAIGGGLAAVLGAGGKTPVGASTTAGRRVLKAGTTSAPLIDEAFQIPVWGYNGSVPGPALRVGQGEAFEVLLENALDEETTINWHGVRDPNAMEGVTHCLRTNEYHDREPQFHWVVFHFRLIYDLTCLVIDHVLWGQKIFLS